MTTLPLSNPPIVGRLHIAFPLSIILTDERYLPWYYDHFIYLRCKKDIYTRHGLDMCFFTGEIGPLDERNILSFNECLEINNISLNLFIENNIDLENLIHTGTNNGYYLRLEADEYYIPQRSSYNSFHFPHYTGIYGYDQSTSMCELIGFDNNLVYKSSTASVEMLKKSLHSAYEILKGVDYTSYINLLKKRDESYNFNLALVFESIKDYLLSKNPEERLSFLGSPGKDYAYGKEIYDYLNIYFEELMGKKVFYDIRNLHILWEHKKCMVQRLKFMETKGFIQADRCYSDKYEKIEAEVLKSRNMMVKYSLNGDAGLLKRIAAILNHVAKCEEELLYEIMEDISKHLNISTPDEN